jgi:hypothetical protein
MLPYLSTSLTSGPQRTLYLVSQNTQRSRRDLLLRLKAKNVGYGVSYPMPATDSRRLMEEDVFYVGIPTVTLCPLGKVRSGEPTSGFER